MTIKTFRKKPVAIKAVRFTGSNFDEVHELTGEAGFAHAVDLRHWVRFDDDDVIAGVYDKLHDTWVGVKAGQWIIRGISGELYPCADDVFAKTYDVVES